LNDFVENFRAFSFFSRFPSPVLSPTLRDIVTSPPKPAHCTAAFPDLPSAATPHPPSPLRPPKPKKEKDKINRSTMSFTLVMRRSGLPMGRRMLRFESTTTSTTANKAADAAKQTASQASSSASEYASKAQQGLSRVTSAAGPAIAGVAKGVTGALGRVGGRTGRLVAFVERMSTPPSPN
jgi:hypothetical protein